MLSARASVLGRGCAGSNALVPRSSYTGLPQLGQANSFGLSDAPPGAPVFLAVGFGNGAPFPQELSAFGMPGCRVFFGIGATQLTFADGVGQASVPLTIPNNAALFGVLFYGQWAVLDFTANAAGITASDYVRVLVGS